MGSIRAMVQTGPGSLELQHFDVPEIGEEEGLLRIEACGICGTDIETLSGESPLPYPVIPGHEPVGTLEAIGERAAARWGLEVGDRVVMQSDFGCGRCADCMRQTPCRVASGNYGFMPTHRAPSIWGGYSELLYLPPGAIPHKIDARIAPRTAALYNPLGAGFAWAVEAAGISYGDTIAILGCGQRGLACVIAAAAVGAARIFVTGLGSRDAHKLALAPGFGAELVIDVEQEDARARVLAETNGLGVDAVVDTTPHAGGPVVDAIHMARAGGTVVLAGIKDRAGISGFPVNDVAMRYLTLRGVRSVTYRSYQRAVRLIEEGRVPFEALHTHHFALEDAAEAVRTLSEAGEQQAIAITVEP